MVSSATIVPLSVAIFSFLKKKRKRFSLHRSEAKWRNNWLKRVICFFAIIQKKIKGTIEFRSFQILNPFQHE
jgi:hypothetical protein